MPFGLNVLPQFEQFHCGCQETNQIHSDPEIQQICFDIPHNISYNGKNSCASAVRRSAAGLKWEWGAKPRTKRCCKYREVCFVGGSRSLGKPEKAGAYIA